MISSILIPTDFSPASWKATQIGLEIARLNQNAMLSLLHIYPMVSRYTKSNGYLEHPIKMDEVRLRMNKLASDLIESPEEKINNVVLSGNVEETMLKFIDENEFDLVILGINGNGSDNNVGSHTLRVLEKCCSPVMVIPNNSRVNGAVTD